MATIPRMMTAIDPAGPGGPEVLQPVERPVPSPGPDEVLIRVHAAGVNRPDILQRLGHYPVPPGAPTIPGLEVAGEVAAVGADVATPSVGDPVCALVAGGGYAQWCVAPAATCLPVPAGMRFAEAAGLPETWFTVWSNLVDQAGARAGDSVLVHGGTSGIGVTAIDCGRLVGFAVLVTAGTDAKCAAALALGAAQAFNYRDGDFAPRVLAATGGAGVDIVLDMVGGDYLPRNLACLKQRGRHVSIAFQRGPRADLDLAMLMRKQLTLTGSMLRPRPVAEKAAIARQLRERVWPAFAEGLIAPRLDRTFPLADAAAAHRYMESGAHVGKIVLTLSPAAG